MELVGLTVYRFITVYDIKLRSSISRTCTPMRSGTRVAGHLKGDIAMMTSDAQQMWFEVKCTRTTKNPTIIHLTDGIIAEIHL